MATKKKIDTALDTIFGIASIPTSSDVEFVKSEVKILVDRIVKNDPREKIYMHDLIYSFEKIEDMLEDGHTLRSQYQYWFALLLFINTGLEVLFKSSCKYKLFEDFTFKWKETSKAIEGVY